VSNPQETPMARQGIEEIDVCGIATITAPRGLEGTQISSQILNNFACELLPRRGHQLAQENLFDIRGQKRELHAHYFLKSGYRVDQDIYIMRQVLGMEPMTEAYVQLFWCIDFVPFCFRLHISGNMLGLTTSQLV
jgi:hypothetical protein